MNLGQTMITMGMFILLVMSVISANQMLVQNTETSFQTEALTESATIANDLFSEAQSNLFDHLVDTNRTDQVPSDFSYPGTSGWGPLQVFALPDSVYPGHPPLSDTASAYTSVESYNGYTRYVDADTTNGIRIGGYMLTVRVFYVDPANTDVAVNYQTNVKRIEVDVVQAQYLPKITYASLMSY